MKVYSKLNLIAAFIIMLLFVSCSSEDSKPTTPSGSGFAPSNVSGMFFECVDPNMVTGNPYFKITFHSNSSAAVTKNYAVTGADITTNSCTYTKTSANAATIKTDITSDTGGFGTFTEKVDFALTFTSKEGGTSIMYTYFNHTDGSIDTNKVPGTFTLKK